MEEDRSWVCSARRREGKLETLMPSAAPCQGGQEEDGATLYLEVHSKSMMGNEHKLPQEKFNSILGENTCTGRVELGP